MTAPLNQRNKVNNDPILGGNNVAARASAHNIPGDAVYFSYAFSDPAGGADVDGDTSKLWMYSVPKGKVLMIKNVDVVSNGTASGVDGSNTALIELKTRGFAAVADAIVTVTDFKNGSYTIAAQPNMPRQITVTHALDGNADTLGIITLTGTDKYDNVISEVLTPVTSSAVTSAYTYKTVTSVVGSGWVTNGNADNITVGTAAVGKAVLASKTYSTVASFPVSGGKDQLTVSDTTFKATDVDIIVPHLTQGTNADLPVFSLHVYGTLIDETE